MKRNDKDWMEIISTLIVSNWQVGEIEVETKRPGGTIIEKKTEIKLRYRAHLLKFVADKKFNFDEAKAWFIKALFDMITYEKELAEKRAQELS